MARAYLNGIRIEMDQNATIADYEGLVGQAAAEMIQFRETWGDDDFFAISRSGDAYTLQRVNGQDVILMGPVPHAPGGLRRGEFNQLDPSRSPAVCFDVQSTASYISGFAVCSSLDWIPIRFFPIDPDRPHSTGNYRQLHADGNPNQAPSEASLTTENVPDFYSKQTEDSVEPLTLISTADVGWDDEWSYTSNNDLGAWSPGIDTTGYPSWMSHHNCPRTLGNCFEEFANPTKDPMIGSYSSSGFQTTNSQCVSPEIPHCNSCAGSPYKWGETQSRTRVATSSSSGNINFLGNVVKINSSSETMTVSSVASGFGCSSQSTRTEVGTYEDSWYHASAVVRGVEGYDDDQTWMAFWTEYSSESWNMTDTISPWMWPPHNNTFPAPGPVTTHQTYWLWIHTPEWEIRMQYADPGSWDSHGGGSIDDVYPWDYNIYDFDGTPIFVFSVYDQREECFVYGSAYQNEIYFSEPFPYDGQYMHDVPDLDPGDGRGRGLCSAVVHVWDNEEHHEYDEG